MQQKENVSIHCSQPAIFLVSQQTSQTSPSLNGSAEIGSLQALTEKSLAKRPKEMTKTDIDSILSSLSLGSTNVQR